MMKVLTSILLLLTSTVNYAQNISGSVQDFHFSNPIDSVSVIIKDNSSGEILGSGPTNEAGNYSIDYTIVRVNDFNPVPSDFYLSNPYPNPFNPSARIDFNTPVQGRFTVRIFNVIGQLVYSKDFTIDAGSHSFNISGLGSAGVYLFDIAGKDFSKTQKLMLLDGGSNNINVELTAGRNGDLKKINMSDLLIEFRKPGYYSKDTIVVWDLNLVVNALLVQVPQFVTAVYNLHASNLQTGENVPNASDAVRD